MCKSHAKVYTLAREGTTPVSRNINLFLSWWQGMTRWWRIKIKLSLPMAWGPSPAALVPSFYSPAAVRVNPVVSGESTCCAINLLLTHFAASSVAKLTHLPVGSLCLVTLLEIARLISARRRPEVTTRETWPQRHNSNPSSGHCLCLLLGNWRQLLQLRTAAAVAAKYQLLPPTVTTRPAAANSTCKTAFRLQRLALQCPWRVSWADLAFSLSLRTFLQGLPTAVAYPCAFSQSVFTRWLSSSHQISHFWSSLGHHGHCCVFGVILGFLEPRESAVDHLLLWLHFPSLTCSSSGGCTATEGLRAMCGPGRRSPLHLQQLRRTADTTFAASQMHLLSL